MADESQHSLLGLVVEMDPDHYKRDDAYEFSNKRKFESTDDTQSGIYKK